MGQSSPRPSRVADLKSTGAKRSAMRPQWLVRPPTMRERNHSKREPGAEVYGSPSMFHAPFGARNSPKFSRACPPTPAPRCGASYGHISILKSFSGLTFGPASSSAQFRPPSVRIFAAMPPPAPEPMMQTSYCFCERITWNIWTISPLELISLHCGNGEIAGARRERHVGERRIHARRRDHAGAVREEHVLCIVCLI